MSANIAKMATVEAGNNTSKKITQEYQSGEHLSRRAIYPHGKPVPKASIGLGFYAE
jgi:hypothetical protein